MLSVSAAEAGRRGTATAAPSIFPGMRLSVATPLFCFCSVMASLQHAGSRFADTGRFLGRGCLSFFFLFLFFVCVAHVSLRGSAGQRVLVNTRICKTSSLTARQLAHTSKCSPFDRTAPSRRWCWQRGGDVRSLLYCVHFSGNFLQWGYNLAKRLSSKHDR